MGVVGGGVGRGAVISGYIAAVLRQVENDGDNEKGGGDDIM
jgi:hypothetical protein